MGYKNLAQCLHDLEATGRLVRIHDELDPDQEIAAVQRRVLRAGGPALLFTNVRGSPFPMAGNLFGTGERIRYIFRDTLDTVKGLFRIKADPAEIRNHFRLAFKLPRALYHARPRTVSRGPILERETSVHSLPGLRSWPEDGGAYVTLPQVYSEDPANPGYRGSNLGMYRVQLTGNSYETGREAGLHYQIHRGIGPHHAESIARGKPLQVNVFVGGPPAMALAAIMPLPEGIPEIYFAGVLAGRRIPMVRNPAGLPLSAEADFCLCGHVPPHRLLPEGPFGDHLGYYSLKHDFPVLSLLSVRHRKGAVWPFTTVGRPPQEDSVIGDFIGELVKPLVSSVYRGIHEINAVDQAGVHPLLLALGSERYVPFASERSPQELLTGACALLGSTQTSLSKYLLICAKEDNPELSTRHVPEFFAHMLERVDWRRDLHFMTRTTMDTLDYSGISLNQGSKVVVAAAGPPRRTLSRHIPELDWPKGFGKPLAFAPGILLLQGPRHDRPRDSGDPKVEDLCRKLEPIADKFPPLVVIADDSAFAGRSWDDFLWVAFTRSDPATDIYGPGAFIHCKHWGCPGPLVIDARLKTYHAPPLEPDPDAEKRADELGAPGGPLHGII
jgi:4-hydroxy-3-polyprenylbenzoate decarboxylase